MEPGIVRLSMTYPMVTSCIDMRCIRMARLISEILMASVLRAITLGLPSMVHMFHRLASPIVAVRHGLACVIIAVRHRLPA